jgi:L-aspartate oxidase
VPGLFAAGEVACTRVHGANRLASNSLLEGLVFGARAGRAIAEGALREADLPPPVFRHTAGPAPNCATVEMSEGDIRALMWKSVGLFRERSSMRDALSLLHEQQSALDDRLASGAPLGHDDWRRASLITVASLIARAALRREESRGGHFRHDFPSHDDLKWKIHVSDTK